MPRFGDTPLCKPNKSKWLWATEHGKWILNSISLRQNKFIWIKSLELLGCPFTVSETSDKLHIFFVGSLDFQPWTSMWMDTIKFQLESQLSVFVDAGILDTSILLCHHLCNVTIEDLWSQWDHDNCNLITINYILMKFELFSGPSVVGLSHWLFTMAWKE